MQRRNRLSRSKDFDTVYRRGRSASSRYLVLHWFPRDDDPDGEPRLGLAVPRSVGSAVARNRVKRLLREKPDARGLTVPGMPAGSPGMEIPDGSTQPYLVELVARDGTTSEYARH